jgi:hypothetical protein
MEDLERYLNEIVEPTIKDFEADPTSVRRAFLACVVVFHGIDYLAYPRKRPSTLRQQFNRKSSAFATVVTGNRKKPKLKADEVISRPPAAWDKAEWNASHWDDPAGGVTIGSDRSVDLLEVVKAARDFLRAKTRRSVPATQTTTQQTTITKK